MEFKPDFKVVAGGVELGMKFFKTLLAVEITGSISGAARTVGMPYTSVWNMLARAERAREEVRRVFPELHGLVVTAGGYKKYEQRIAFVYEPRAKQTLLFAQVFWHGFMSPHIDLSTGIAMFMGSRNDDGWTGLNFYTRRDLLWFEFTYYLL